MIPRVARDVGFGELKGLAPAGTDGRQAESVPFGVGSAIGEANASHVQVGSHDAEIDASAMACP